MRCGATPKVQPNGGSSGYQQLTIPATATKATLGFWYYASATGAQATQTAAVRDPGGRVVIPIFSGQDNSQRWTYKEVDLSGLIGKVVQIYFDAHGAKGQPSTLFVDDVTLKVQ
jgi:hypothetical protein